MFAAPVGRYWPSPGRLVVPGPEVRHQRSAAGQLGRQPLDIVRVLDPSHPPVTRVILWARAAVADRPQCPAVRQQALGDMPAGKRPCSCYGGDVVAHVSKYTGPGPEDRARPSGGGPVHATERNDVRGLPLHAGLPDDALVRSAVGVAQQPEDGADPSLGLDAELQAERALLEDLQVVADAVVAPVL